MEPHLHRVKKPHMSLLKHEPSKHPGLQQEQEGKETDFSWATSAFSQPYLLATTEASPHSSCEFLASPPKLPFFRPSDLQVLLVRDPLQNHFHMAPEPSTVPHA